MKILIVDDFIAPISNELASLFKAYDKVRIVEHCNLPSIYICPEIILPEPDMSFRGGSIGKGGKVKYRRC